LKSAQRNSLDNEKIVEVDRQRVEKEVAAMSAAHVARLCEEHQAIIEKTKCDAAKEIDQLRKEKAARLQAETVAMKLKAAQEAAKVKVEQEAVEMAAKVKAQEEEARLEAEQEAIELAEREAWEYMVTRSASTVFLCWSV